MRPRLFGLVVAFGLLAGVNGFGVTARDLLSSPYQGRRELGAQILRGTFVLPPRANWDLFVKRLKPGMKQAALENALQQANASRPLAAVAVVRGTNGVQLRTYRLDDVWVLNCSFTNAATGKVDPGLSSAQVEEQLNNVWVDVPANFSGPWVTYWVNGQRSNEAHYQYGKLDGISTSFNTDGSKSVVLSYHNGVLEGEETGYFPSEKIKYKGQYKAGTQVGHWVFYKADGKVESEKDFGK
jgi:hypothetical protein